MDWLLFSLRLLAVVVLYAFLATAVYVVWQDLRANTGVRGVKKTDAGGSQVPVPRAAVSLDPAVDLVGTAARQYELLAETHIGRASDNDIVLVDDCVSGRHARIGFRDGCWWLQDLSSRNGTFLNGVAVEGAVVLRDMDAIRLGNSTLVLHLDPEPQGG